MVEEHEFCESKAAQNSNQATKPSSDGFMSIPDGVEDEGLPF